MDAETHRTLNLLGAFVCATQDSMRARMAAKCARGGEEPAAIVFVGTNPGLSERCCSEALGLSHSGTVRLLDRLAGEGLLERRAHADRRTVALHLTAKGARRMRALLSARMQALHVPLAALTAGERVALADLLEKMLAPLTTDDQAAERICRLCDGSACPQDRCPVTRAAESAALNK